MLQYFYIAYLSDRKKRKGQLWLLGQTKYSLMKNLDGEMMVGKSCVVVNFFFLGLSGTPNVKSC